MPVFLFSVLFALSMDYHVFLLTRIRERYVAERRHGRRGRARDRRRPAGIITGAALIIVAVFAGFAAGDLVMFQQMGFGVGVALLIDATIIRGARAGGVTLLGEWNWYLPRWLEWLPHVSRGRAAAEVKRCEWVPLGDPGYVAYHDEEWGVPSRDDGTSSSCSTLEGAQAGLSWSTILRKREGYRRGVRRLRRRGGGALRRGRRRAADGRRGHRAEPAEDRVRDRERARRARPAGGAGSSTSTSGASSAASRS